jgi:hypothetical protein
MAANYVNCELTDLVNMTLVHYRLMLNLHNLLNTQKDNWLEICICLQSLGIWHPFANIAIE